MCYQEGNGCKSRRNAFLAELPQHDAYLFGVAGAAFQQSIKLKHLRLVLLLKNMAVKFISNPTSLDEIRSRFIHKDDFEKVVNNPITSLSIDQLNEVVWLLNICESISLRYPEVEDAYGMGVRGMRLGLANYRDRQIREEEMKTKKYKLASYLTWYIVTAIELAAGIENDDTRLLAKKFKEGHL